MSEEEVVPENIIQLNLNNVLAAIVKTFGGVSIPIDDVLAGYEDKSLAVTFDEDARVLEITLVDNSEVME